MAADVAKDPRQEKTATFGQRHTLDYALNRADRVNAYTLGLIALVSCLITGVLRGVASIPSCLVAVVIAAIVVMIGSYSNRLVLKKPLFTSGIMMGSYLLKVILVLLAVVVLKRVDWIDSPVIFLVLVGSFLLNAFIEAWVLTKSKIYIVDPVSTTK